MGSMILYGEYVDVVFLAASNNLLDFVPDVVTDTSFGLTGCVGQGPNVVCGDTDSLADVCFSSAGGSIRDMDSVCSALTMLRHVEPLQAFERL